MTARGGFVLLYSLLLALTAATLTAGMLALAAREDAIARRYVELARARLAAEAEARSVFGSWSTAAYREIPPDAERIMAGRQPHTRAIVSRLDTTLFLISAESSIPAGAEAPLVARAGMLVRTSDQDAIEAFFSAALGATASAALRGGRVSGRDACRPETDQSPGATAPAVSLQGTRVEGDPAVQLDPPPSAPAGWPLESANAAALADIRLDLQDLTPGPHAVDGLCIPGPSNWGALSALHPCGDLQQIIYSPADLTIRGGEGRGILIVEGSLILQGDFEFRGLVLTSGTLSLLPGVRIRGALRAGMVDLEDAEVLMDRCALQDALGAPALDRAYRPGERWWVPLF